MTALEAFGGEERAPERGRRTARLDRALGKLRRAFPGVALEILEGPWTGGGRAGAESLGAQEGAAVRWLRARTQGEWLARAGEWLQAAPRRQESALAVALGHLMDYFAVWSDASEPFVWTSAPPARARAPLAPAWRAQPGG